MSNSIYLSNTYLTEHSSVIVGHGNDEKGTYLVFNETIFYPQGGGQPSDQGLIKIHGMEIPVSFVRQVEQEIRHYVDNADIHDLISAPIELKIDKQRRLINARYHTAAHLLSNIVESIHFELKAIKGHSFPNEAYVEFNGNIVVDIPKIEKFVTESIQQNLPITIFEMLPDEFESTFYKLPYPAPSHKKFRASRIGNLNPIPCGGTHLTSTAEIGQFAIPKNKIKGERIIIFYEVT